MHLVCPDCKEVPPNLVEEYASGDMVCGDCGLVLGGRIVDTHSEWRTFSNDDQNNDDPSRVGDGPNVLLNGDQLQTTISFGDGGRTARDLNRAQNRTMQDKGNKALMAAYKQIGAICDNMHLEPKVNAHAKFLFKTVHDTGSFRGKQTESVIAGVVFISCRHFKVGRSFREINAITQVPKKEIGRIFKNLEKFFEAHNAKLEGKLSCICVSKLLTSTLVVIPDANNTAATTAAELSSRYCSRLNLSNDARMIAEKLAAKVDRVGALDGRSPLSAAAACIYFASHLMKSARSAKEIANVVGVSDGTIRTAYRYLWDKKDTLIEANWLTDKDGNVRGDTNELPKP